MLLALDAPQILPLMTQAGVDVIYPRPGDQLRLGAKIMDLTVDLSAAAPQDCPPVSHYRLTIREAVWLRRLWPTAGGLVRPGEPLALFSTEPDEPLDQRPARAVRVSLIGILPESGVAETWS